MSKVNSQIRDSMFKYIYSFDKYRRNIAGCLLGSTYAAASIEEITLDGVFLNDIQNDLGLLVGNTMILLVKAQSTTPTNIALRMFQYITKTISNYLHDKETPSIYGQRRILLPAVKLYVVFTGDDVVPDNYALSSHFVGGSDVELVVHVLSETTPNLPSSVYDYIRFSKFVNELVHRGVKGDNFVRELVDFCIKNGILLN